MKKKILLIVIALLTMLSSIYFIHREEKNKEDKNTQSTSKVPKEYIENGNRLVWEKEETDEVSRLKDESRKTANDAADIEVEKARKIMNLKIDVHKEVAKKLDMQNLRKPLEDHLILVDMWADVTGVKSDPGYRIDFDKKIISVDMLAQLRSRDIYHVLLQYNYETGEYEFLSR